MSNGPFLQLALWLTDQFYAAIPRRMPSRAAFENCRIVSHRGEHDNKVVLENTMNAFRIARDAGVWGLETDIRWTKDLVPMVAHDPDTNRVFKRNMTIADVSFADLREAIPEIPTLEEFVQEFGGDAHLMIEIKDEVFPDIELQKTTLTNILANLEPGKDYHLLALKTDLFKQFDIVPNSAFLPVALFNYKTLHDAAVENGYAGLSGHFLVLNSSMKRVHDAQGQLFGTGFPTSKNALFRELNRGVNLVFTNDAVKLLNVVRQHVS